MQNQKIKKLLAGMLAATMVLGMGTTAFAQTGTTTGNGSGTGTGSFEGHVDKEVVAVTLPTAEAATFSYKMDPEGLIAATNQGKYPGASFEAGKNVYFLSGKDTWTADSAKLKVVNKGTVDVDVTVIAKTAANANVTMSTTDTFAADDTAAKLYLGLKVANKAAVAVATDETGKVAVGLRGNEENYEVTSTESGYAYTAKTGVPDTAWNSFEFGLTGACNPKGDYSAENLAGSDVTVTWSYAVRADDSTAELLAANATSDAAPSITTTSYTYTPGTAVEVPVNLGSGNLVATGISSVTFNNNGVSTTLPSTRWSYSDGKLIFSADYCGLLNNITRVHTITFNDTAKTTVDVTLQPQSN